MQVFYNPSCSKCRALAALLRERGVAFEIVDYLETPPDRATLERIVAMPGVEAAALVRRDQRFRELGLDDSRCATPGQVVDVLVAHPELLERPLVVQADRAILARPPERVLELLD